MSAIFTQRIGYYVPAMLLCPCVMAVGEGLLSTFKPDTDSAHWIAYQFLTGFGLGLGMQTAGLSVQATLPKEDMSTGMAIMFFCQQLGGAIFVSVGQTILNSFLVKRLSGVAGLDPQTIVRTGATDLHKVVPAEYFEQVIDAYNYACTRIFLAAMGITLTSLICAMFMKWVSIKKQGPPKGAAPKAETVEEVKKEEK
jgi:MFS family permease